MDELKVYLAARFPRLSELLTYKAELEAAGITVTSRWLLGGHDWVGVNDEDIPVAHQARFAQEDIDDINAADAIVCFTESSGSGPARGGRHVEAGYALAKGIPVAVVGHRENVFYCLPQVAYFPTWEDARGLLVSLAEERTAGAA